MIVWRWRVVSSTRVMPGWSSCSVRWSPLGRGGAMGFVRWSIGSVGVPACRGRIAVRWPVWSPRARPIRRSLRVPGGELSIDQAALAVQARPEHEGDIAVWAKVMTLAQLRLAVRASNVSGAERDAVNATGVVEPADHPQPEPEGCQRCVSTSRCDRTWMGRGGCMVASMPITALWSMPPSVRPATGCSATATMTSRGSTRLSMLPDGRSMRRRWNGATGSVSTCSWTQNTRRR